jgi:tRNA1(Val) A37 N6-methylase TrmN6
MAAELLETTQDAVLGGRLTLRQPKRGHRVGHDAILLAAATGARSGELAIDLGAGVGAAGLALAARIAGLQVGLIEIDPDLCALAEANITLNGMNEQVRAVLADVEDGDALAAAGLVAGRADRVLMNPPFNVAGQQQASPDPGRRLAHLGDDDLLPRWVAAAARLLKPQGVLTLIWRADGMGAVRQAVGDQFGGVAILPVLPRSGGSAIRVLVRAVKGGGAGEVIFPELVLNDAKGRPTTATEAVLRHGNLLPLGEL